MTTSRNPTPRPRRVAGRAQRSGDSPAVVEEVAQQPSRDQVAEATSEPEPPTVQEGSSTGSPGLVTGARAPSSTIDGSPEPGTAAEQPPARRATLALVLAVVVLTAVAVLQVAYLWGPLKDDPQVSSQRPVLLSQAAERSAVDTAAKAATAFTQRSHDTYDEQVDEAAAMMTDDFAKEFRQTTDDAKERFVEAEAQVTAEVAAQGVMTASEQQVEVLIFLNQFTIKKDEESAFTAFRLKVTLIDTEQGWLVSDVDAT